jgi:hypothetical protein
MPFLPTTSIPLLCSATLAGTHLILALTMSMMRVSGVSGKGVAMSSFERIHTVQLLNAEWAPLIIAPLLYADLRARIAGTVAVDPLFANIAVAITAARILFVCRAFVPSKIAMVVSMPSMIACYTLFPLLWVFAISA